MKLKLSKYVLISESLDDNDGLTGKRMMFSTRTSMGISVTNYVVELCKKANFSELPNNLFNILMFHEMVVPEDQEETAELLKIKGIIGDDVSEINQNISINLASHTNEQTQNYLNEVIEKTQISSKTKKLTVFLQAGFINFSLNKSNLHQVRSFIESRVEFQKIKIEYNLICGIPIDDSIDNTDLEWIENIHIIKVLNTTNKDFKQALLHLNIFSESVKLKMKLNVRLIFDSNFNTKIKENHELIKTIKKSILRFSLIKENYNDFDLWIKKELEFLQTINDCEIHCVQLPDTTYKYLDQSFKLNTGFHYEYFDDFVIIIIDDSSTIIYKQDLQTQETNSFKTKSPTCYSCLYLSMCGGRINKFDENNIDCPDIRSNIILKARMKYKI